MHIYRRSSWNSELPMKILIWESQAVERMRRRLIAICGGSSACFSGVPEIMECCWGCQLACCHKASLCHQTVSGKPAHGIIAHIPNKNHLVFLHYESWQAADFLSKAQIYQGFSWLVVVGAWLCESQESCWQQNGKCLLKTFVFSPIFLACPHEHFPWPIPETVAEEYLIYIIFHILVSLQFLEDRWWFLMLPFCSLSKTGLYPVERNGTLVFLEARPEPWGSLLIVYSHI